MPPLKNVKREKFCLYYFQSGNVAESAVKAGYSVKSIRSISSSLLTFTNIKKRLLELQSKAESDSIMSVIERKQRLSEIARGDLADFVDQDGETVNYSKDHPNHRAVTEFSIATTYTKRGEQVVTKSIKLHNPISAIAELNKMGGDYAPTKTELTGKDGKPIQVETKTDLSGLTDEELNTVENILNKTADTSRGSGRESPPPSHQLH